MGRPEFIITYTNWDGDRYIKTTDENKAKEEFNRLSAIYVDVHMFRAYEEM